MNVEELRAALHEHARDVEDMGAPARVAATHQRVVVVRRRRRAGVAAIVAAAVIAVVTAGTLTILPRHQTVEPAQHDTPARLAGYKVQPVYQTEPWTFRYVRGVQSAKGQNLLDLRVPASSRPRVLGWGVATDDFSGRAATLSMDGVVVDHSSGGAWTTGIVLPAGPAHHLTVRFRKPARDHRIGIAVYDMVGRPPGGVTNGTTTFRRYMAGDRLLGAHFGQQGDSQVSLDVTAPDGRISFSVSCAGEPGRAMADITVNGSPVGSTGCERLPQLDAAGNRFGPGDQRWAHDLGIAPGATLHVTVKLRDQRAGNPVLGIGVYHDAPAVAHVAGWGIPALVEGPDGVYRYTSSAQSRPGARRLVLHLPLSPQRRLVQYATAHARGMITLRVDGSINAQDQNSAGGGALGGGEPLRPGRPYTITLSLRHGASPRTVLGLIVSTKVR